MAEAPNSSFSHRITTSWIGEIGAFLQTHYVFAILILIWILASIASPYFRMMATVSTILTSAVPIALIGLAQVWPRLWLQ
jgi:hypothetical protein